MVRLGEPVDDHIGLEIGQHVVAKHPFRPADLRGIRILGAALFGCGRKAAQDGVVHRVRERNPHARLPIGVHQHADALRRARVDQERASGRAGADHGEGLAAFGEDFPERLRKHHALAGGGVEAEQVLVIVIAE